MKPIPFKQQNVTFEAEGCGDLPACQTIDPQGNYTVTTVWTLSEEDLANINRHKKVWLIQVAKNPQPVSIHSSTVFINDGENENNQHFIQEAENTEEVNRILPLLAKLSNTKRAKVWCALNGYNIPEGIEPPHFWHIGGTNVRKRKVTKPLMDAIEQQIGLKDCLREWNKDAMTREEFDAYWKRNGKDLMNPEDKKLNEKYGEE